jgi:hypothetical protein
VALIVGVPFTVAALAFGSLLVEGKDHIEVVWFLESLAVALGAILFYVLSLVFNRPSTKRARELCEWLGMPPDLVEAVLARGKVTIQSLDEYLKARPDSLRDFNK